MFEKLPKKFIKYFLVGGIAFITDYSLSMLFFSFLNFTEVLSNSMSVFMVSIMKFFINKKFTFKNVSKRAKEQLIMSFVVMGFYLIFTSTLVYLFSNIMKIPFYITKVIVVFLGVSVNYFLDKNLTFNKRFD
ncbi:MAG: GtrA family protein [Candidatus Nanoarchaeia archaeon]|nr:GtrA family protein [Candidatus Nanoarchaeia archaeon]